MITKKLYEGSLGANLDPIPLLTSSPKHDGLSLSQFQAYNGIILSIKPSVIGGGAAKITMYESVDGSNYKAITGTAITLNSTSVQFIRIGIDNSSGNLLPLGAKTKLVFSNYDSGTYTFTIHAQLCNKGE